jgi:4-O-beta-D-mannosyl-D-glucose phosphorylase
MAGDFRQRLSSLVQQHRDLIDRPNRVDERYNSGLYDRFVHPVVTAEHVPLFWRFDLDEKTNPHLMERQGVNATLNPGAIEWEGKVLLAVRVEGADRKSFFGIAESASGIDGFRFWDYPVLLDETPSLDTNVYDVRLTRHADGWVYGLFCTERKDPAAPLGDTSSAVAQCGIIRTRDMKRWERLPDLVSQSAQQRNVVLHPEFVNGKYALYTRPQDSFIEAGKGGGIGWALCDSMEKAVIGEEKTIDPRVYHTIKESKNGQGPAPIKTDKGWLHIAHGVRNTAAGLRYVVYAFMSDLNEPWRVTHRPAGYLIGCFEDERVGDVSNVIFCNGAVARPNGELLIYYASSDTRCHVARTSVEKMVEYCRTTPEDGLRSRASVEARTKLIEKNLRLIAASGDPLLAEIRDPKK